MKVMLSSKCHQSVIKNKNDDKANYLKTKFDELMII